jgi:hypothetical protein
MKKNNVLILHIYGDLELSMFFFYSMTKILTLKIYYLVCFLQNLKLVICFHTYKVAFLTLIDT